MMIRILKIAVLLLIGIMGLFMPSKLYADDIWRGGSMYAQFGAGLPYNGSTAFTSGMGVTGLAIFDSRQANNANPAIWSRSTVSNFSGMLEVNSYSASFRDEKSTMTNFTAGPIQMVVPLKRDRVGLSLSLTPLTNMSYRSTTDYVLPENQNHSGDDIMYYSENSGNGGFNRLELGIGVRVYRNISIGYAPSLILGVLRTNQHISFDHVDYGSMNLQSRESHYGMGNRFGLYIHENNVFRNEDRLSFGATFSLPVTLHSDKTLNSRVNRLDLTVHPSSYYGDGRAEFPVEAGAGFAYFFNPQIMLSADVLYQNWEQYKNYAGDNEVFYQNRLRLGVGSQFITGGRDASAFFSRFIYRIGLSYDTGHLSLNDKRIESMRIHAGLGIPSSRTRSSIDISAEYGYMGTEAADLTLERVFSLKVSFNLSELMFMQRLLQ